MKKYIWPVLGYIILPVIAFVITMVVARPSFNFDDSKAVLILALIFILIIAVELVLTILYIRISRKIQTSNELKQEEKIEKSGKFDESDDEQSSEGYVDAIMKNVIKKKNYKPLTRQEILDYCMTLNSSVETNVVVRQQNDLPDIISAGDKSYCMLYEREGIIKFVIKNSSFYIESMKNLHPDIVQVAKVSDWYEIIYGSSFIAHEQVYDLLKTSYEYVISASYMFIDGAYVKNEGVVHDANEKALAKKSVKDDDVVFVSALEKKQKLAQLTLTTREAIADYVEANIKGEYPAYVIRRKGFALYSMKVADRSYGLLYERENVVRMWLRFDTEYAKQKMRDYPTMIRAKFPKGKDWYSMVFDEHFDEDSKISELAWTSYYYVCNEYLVKKGVPKNSGNQE